MVPPDAPTTARTAPSPPTTMVGTMEERGLLPGRTKLAERGERWRPCRLPLAGEKSAISLLRMMPVRRDTSAAPKYQLMVLVTATASPLGARMELCEVPASSGGGGERLAP